VYLARGRARLAAHQRTLAEADFLSGIQVFERMRSGLTSEALRTSYFEQPWDLFTEMIRLQADGRDAGRALIYAERARARTLLEAVDQGADTAPLSPSDVQSALPPGVAVVYYASLDDRLLIWLLTRDTDQFVSTSTRQIDLARLVERCRMEFGADSRTSTLTALYDLLIRPIEPGLPSGASLIIVPDGVLHAVPFAALIRRENNRHLVEDHALETTPSLTILGRSMKHVKPAATGLASALVLGNPRAQSPAAPALPEAEREARDIAALYPNHRLLVDIDASKSRFMTLAADYDVVHFAGHSVSNDDYPALSRLLLAGAD
jgi:CHAT domain-containing protein